MTDIPQPIEFEIFLNHEFARIPMKAHPSDSGYDLFSCEHTVILSNQWKAIDTGIIFKIPPGYEIQIRARSGLALNKGIGLMNGIGTIDTNYTGLIKVILYNAGEYPFEIHPGDKIAQAVMCPVLNSVIKVIREIPKPTDRGRNGFGSTDKK